jgi:CubicO group peptidase (beta-lactamase class C family)
MGLEFDFAELEREMAQQIESGLRPSIQIAVDFAGELVFERALGDGATVDSTYVLWSSTKPLVAVALLQLVEEGRAALDDRVAKHFPEFGKLGKERCTILHLLTHRGGFPDSKPATRAELLRISRDWDASLAFVCDMEALWEPGTDRGYHQLSAWFVVGELVQRLDGRPLAESLNARVLEPLGVPRDGFCLGRPQDLAAPPMTVRTRDAKNAPTPREAEFWSDPTTHAACIPGALGIARARTLAAFYRALLDGGKAKHGRILSAEMTRTATFPHVVGIRDRTMLRDMPWGLGMHLKHVLPAIDDCGKRATPGTFGHGGHFMVNTGWGDPGRNVAAAILSNGLAEPVAGMRAVCALSDAIHDTIDRATAGSRG